MEPIWDGKLGEWSYQTVAGYRVYFPGIEAGWNRMLDHMAEDLARGLAHLEYLRSHPQDAMPVELAVVA